MHTLYSVHTVKFVSKILLHMTVLVLTTFYMAGWIGQREQAVEAKTITGSRNIVRGVRGRAKAIFESVEASCSAAAGDEG